MNKKSKILLITLLLGIFLCLTAIYVYNSIPRTFIVTEYVIPDPSVTPSVRIAHLSDVHNKEYGDDNAELIEAVSASNPDLIFITGDSVNNDEQNIEPAVRLVEQLTKIAPVYFSYGNHELMNEENFGGNIGAHMEAAGATVLDFAYQDVDIHDQKLRIGGIYGYCVPSKYLETNEADEEECAFLSEFQNTDRTTILLAHMPYSWIDLDGLNEWNVDIIFAGHSHGGQMDLPLFGPVYAPDQGWFPDEVSGKFISDDGEKTLIVSRGLGDSVEIPRLNNDWELVVVDLVPSVGS